MSNIDLAGTTLGFEWNPEKGCMKCKSCRNWNYPAQLGFRPRLDLNLSNGRETMQASRNPDIDLGSTGSLFLKAGLFLLGEIFRGRIDSLTPMQLSFIEELSTGVFPIKSGDISIGGSESGLRFHQEPLDSRVTLHPRDLGEGSWIGNLNEPCPHGDYRQASINEIVIPDRGATCVKISSPDKGHFNLTLGVEGRTLKASLFGLIPFSTTSFFL